MTRQPSAQTRKGRAQTAPASAHGGGVANAWLHDERVLETLFYVLVAVVTCAATWWLLELWRTDLRVLWINSQDSMSVAESVNNLIRHGWYFVNPDVGAPGVLNTLDFPSFDLFHWIVLKAIGTVTGNAAVTVNGYYLLGYPLAALAAAYVLRRFDVSRPAAFAAAVLFAFVPYHVFRGTAHLTLAAYYLIPFVIMIAMRFDMKSPPLFTASGGDGRDLRLTLRSKESLGYGALALLIGLTGIYYAYFAVFFFLVGGAYAALRGQSWKRMASALGMCVPIVVGIGGQMIPTLVYGAQHGSNAQAAGRVPSFADVWGLRISRLILPLEQHRSAAVTQTFAAYWKQLALDVPTAGSMSEVSYVTLGIVATIGFLALLAWLIFGRFKFARTMPRFGRMMDGLGVLNVSALLLATVGGFGAVIALALPQIRCYNRISIFLAFMALFAVALLLDLLAKRFFAADPGRYLFMGICGLILIFGLLDQTNPALLPKYDELAQWDKGVTAVVSALEQTVPDGAMVFQLPFVAFPEGQQTGSMTDYEHFQAPLHATKSLRWSYGAMKGRAESDWQAQVSQLPAKEMIAQLKQTGFKAVWVDKAGYSDGGTSITKELTAATGGRSLIPDAASIAIYLIR